MRRGLLLLGASIVLGGLIARRVFSTRAPRSLIFIGTQAGAIFTASFDETNGSPAPPRPVAEVERPTWLLAHPTRPILFAVSELGNAGDRHGEVMSFAVEDAQGSLRRLGRTGSGGGGPTHLDLEPERGTLFVANYGGGEVAAIPVAPDGTLASVNSVQVNSGSGPHRRQQGPHAHGVTLDPSRTLLLVPDMGADRIFSYHYDAARKLLSAAVPAALMVPPGSGPRLLLFGRDGRFAYLLTELSAEIYVFRYDRRSGALSQVGCVALDPATPRDMASAAGFAISGNGRFLYASNRVANDIHVYTIDRRTGLPTEIQRIAAGGAKPWSLTISPSGRWLIAANQSSDTLTTFSVSRGSGMLAPAAGAIAIPTPTAVVFAKAAGG